MANSFVEYTADGVDTQFAVTFPFIARLHVTVTIDGVDDATFTWINDGLIQPTTTPLNLEKVRITRTTPTGALVLTDFTDGSTLVEADMDRVLKQTLYVSEESNDAVTTSLRIATDDATKWDATTKIIKNVVDPTADQHAATKKYGDDNWGGASATAAAASAVTSANEATDSAASAVTSANEATASAASATAAAASAVTAANAAKTVFMIAVSDEGLTAITTGVAKVTFRMPFALTLTAVRASLSTVSSSGIPTIDINEAGSTILSTKLTIDASEKTSATAATPVVISDAALADDAEITIDIDIAGSGAKGLKVYLIGDPA